MADLLIENIINIYLQRIVDGGINSKPGEVEQEMRVSESESEGGWNKWIPIASKVTDDEILEFESRLGYKLPADYVDFLKHKHFYELYFRSYFLPTSG